MTARSNASWTDAFAIAGRPSDQDRDTSAWLRIVEPGYFSTMKLVGLRGRSLAPQDDEAHPGAVVVNEAFARRFFPAVEAVGQALQIPTPRAMWPDVAPDRFEIVGVVKDERFLGPGVPSAPAYYISARQFRISEFTVLLRTDGDPMALLPGARAIVRTLDPLLPVAEITTVGRLYGQVVAQPRFNMILLGAFGILALLLSVVGIYGLLSYVVEQRVQEVGVRMALGADARAVVRLFVGQGLGLAAIGLTVGLGSAALLTRVMAGLLHGVSPLDPMTFATVTVLLATIAALASYIPARRAGRLDPSVALRGD